MTNETVGDAISDLFLVETVLCARGDDVTQWMASYKDLPCRQLKVTVKVSLFFCLVEMWKTIYIIVIYEVDIKVSVEEFLG